MATERMPSTDAEAPIFELAVILKAEQSVLHATPSFQVKLEIRILDNVAEEAQFSKGSDGISRIMSAMMESCAIDLETTECAISIMHGRTGPFRQGLHISIFHPVFLLEQG